MKTFPLVQKLKRARQLLLLGLVLPLTAATAAEIVPLDPAVRTGRLANGLTYYIRQNTKPEKRVELRLAVNTGSVQEDDDQRGLAHFVEHLSFRGTARYPGVALIHYLQSLGAGFGPDINATTSFDETVYRLTLPTDSEDTLRQGVEILSDWAHGVTLAPADIDKERGVMIEEWRLGRGAEQRMGDKIVPVLFQDSRYAQRLPIGTKESLEGSGPEALRRFYHDWYRPDNMAVVVVGDIDPGRIETALRAEFGKIPAAASPRVAPPVVVPGNQAPLFAIVSDKENPLNVAALIWKTEPGRYQTPADYRRDLAETLFSVMLNLRLRELQQQANPPFLQAQAGHGRLMARAKSGFQLGVIVAEGGLERGLSAAYAEVIRVQRHGFIAAELDRAKATLLKLMEHGYNERDKTPSAVFADTYVRHHLQDDPAPGIEFIYGFAQSQLPKITLEEVNALAARWITPDNRVFIVKSVEKEGVRIPTEQALQAVVQKVEAGKIEPYTEKKIEGSLLASRPVPGQIVAAKPLEVIQALELAFANGVRVVLKPTNFQNDEILLSAYRPGGQSVFPDDHHLSAQLASAYLAEAGAGKFPKTELQKLLAGKNVSLAPHLAPYFDGLKGKSSAADFETLLQLVYLTFAEPRADETAYGAVVNRQKGLLQSARANPVLAFMDEAQRFLYGNHPRTPNALPAEADWATVTFDKVKEISRSRFASANGYTFVIVGAFNPAAVAPLLSTYLGGLPARPGVESWKDLGLRMAAGPLTQSFQHGKEPLSIVLLNIETPVEWSAEEGHRFWSLGNILSRTLHDKLRLQAGGVYDFQLKAELTKAPYARMNFTMVMPCAPTNADKLAQAVRDEIKRVQEQGLTPDEIKKETESQRRTLEKEAKDNSRWLGKLEMIYRDGETLTRLAEPEKLVDLVTAPELQTMAAKYLDTGKLVRITLYPEATVAKAK